METKKLTEKTVEMVLADRPRSRDDDELLCQILESMWYRDDHRKCYFYNAVGRRRRNIQKKWLYPAISPVSKRRQALKEVYKTEYTPSKKQIQEYSLQEVMAW